MHRMSKFFVLVVTIIAGLTAGTCLAQPKPAGTATPQIKPVAESPVPAQEKKVPNILVIWGDDIGWFNTSAYNRGMMGYQHETPTTPTLAMAVSPLSFPTIVTPYGIAILIILIEIIFQNLMKMGVISKVL